MSLSIEDSLSGQYGVCDDRQIRRELNKMRSYKIGLKTKFLSLRCKIHRAFSNKEDFEQYEPQFFDVFQSLCSAITDMCNLALDLSDCEYGQKLSDKLSAELDAVTNEFDETSKIGIAEQLSIVHQSNKSEVKDNLSHSFSDDITPKYSVNRSGEHLTFMTVDDSSSCDKQKPEKDLCDDSQDQDSRYNRDNNSRSNTVDQDVTCGLN